MLRSIAEFLMVSLAINFIQVFLLWNAWRAARSRESDWGELIDHNTRLINENDDLHKQLVDVEEDRYGSHADDDDPDETLDPEPWEFEDEGERWTR